MKSRRNGLNPSSSPPSQKIFLASLLLLLLLLLAVRRLDGLNEQQQEAVLSSPHAPLLVIAGAGSGKTTTMVQRIEHIIETTGCAAREVLAITFTRNAADEMRERLKRGSGSGSGKGVVILTIHSFCLRLLRAYLDRLGDDCYDGHFTVASKHEQTLIVEDALEAYDSTQPGSRGKGEGGGRRGSGGIAGGGGGGGGEEAAMMKVRAKKMSPSCSDTAPMVR